jgi:curved DNA-binding protein CbpA
MRKDYQEFYRVLNLNPGATPAEIKRSYHQIIRRWHPDLFKPGSLMQKTAEDITKETNEAFEQLFKKRHYRKFPPPGEAQHAKPPRAARRPSPKATGSPKSPKKSAPRFTGWPWGRMAAAACAAGVILAGFALRGEIRGLFRGSAPAATATAAAAGAPTGGQAGPAGLASVSVPIAAVPETPGPGAWTSISPLLASEGRASRPSPEQSQRVDEPIPEQTTIAFRSPSPETRTDNSLTSMPEGSASRPDEPPSPSHLARILDETTARLSTFGVGDSKARVLEIQGRPDEDLGSVLRYGSSLVYFSNGWVRDWSDRYPRLSVRRWPTIPLHALGFFEMGSDRSDVIRAQGLPTGVTSFGYTYGTAFVFFENDRVSVFGDGDLRLNSLVLPTLPRLDIDQLP